MIEKHRYLIHKYWSRTELGRKMIDSNNVSESDLLFLIPNNVKKKYGLPLTRISGKEKRKQKKTEKRFIMSFRLFDLVEEVIEKNICSKWATNEFFEQFVDFKEVRYGKET